MFSVRRAESKDALALARVAESTFRATFDATNSAENMAAHCRNNYSEEIQSSEIRNPDMVNLLCEQEGALIGFAQLRWGEPPACVKAKRAGEIQRLYVVESAHGKGVAQALMNACIEELQRRNFDAIWLGVWEHNPRAIAFYIKIGFVEVGEHIFPLGGDPQRDVIMLRPIAPKLPARPHL
jgi:ribosomal protein S18 acetylase RimI-like enzyme